LPTILKVVIVLVVILGIFGVAVGLMIMRDMRRSNTKDEKTPPMHPLYLAAFQRFNNRKRVIERSLPSIGGSSGSNLIATDISVSHGMEQEEIARIQGYLEMLDPDLVDDVTRSDVDSYSILGVSLDAQEDEIRQVYLCFVKRYHPDKLIGKDEAFIQMAREELRKKNRARAILIDPQKRALVDKMLRDSEGDIIRTSSVMSMDRLKTLGRK